MRKLITTVSLAAAFFLALPFSAQAGVPEAVTYLKTVPADEWVVQAQVAAGETNVDKTALQSFSGTSATDYAKRILAIVAVGENPRTFAGADLVQGLQNLASAGQLGDTQYLNDDAWGILALRAAGVPAADPVVSGATAYLLAHQGADGGWSYDIAGISDTNDTAAVLMALADVGVTASTPEVASALAYLHSQQQPDGGFTYQAPCSWPGCEASDSASTSWVVDALSKLGQQPSAWAMGANTPLTFLASLQQPDGSYKLQAGDPSGSAGMTAYAVVAISGHWYPVSPLVPLLVIPSCVGCGGRRQAWADISVSAAVPSGEYHPGDTVSYTITLQNQGPDTATNLDVRVIGFKVASAVAAQASQGTLDPSSGVWVMDHLDPGASVQAVGTVVLPPTLGEFTPQVRANASEIDSATNNNQAEFKFTVTAAPPVVEEPTPAVLGASEVGCQLWPGALAAGQPTGFVLVDLGAERELWYVDPVTREASCAEGESRVVPLLRQYALGITNSDLERLPEVGAAVEPSPLAQRLAGRILLQVEEHGEAWYVDPATGARTYLPPATEAFVRVRSLAPVIAKP